MREIIGLMVFLTIAGSAITLSVKKWTGNALTAILLIFSLAAGWGIVNYDWIQKLEWQVPGLEPFERRVLSIKEDAVGEMFREIEIQKESVNRLVSHAKEVHEDLGVRKESLQSLLDTITKLEDVIKDQEQKARELSDKAQKMQDQLVAVHRASSELALLLTRVTWLNLEARDEYGIERAQAAVQRIMDELDQIVDLVIVDPGAKEEFISDVKNSLPPRQEQTVKSGE